MHVHIIGSALAFSATASAGVLGRAYNTTSSDCGSITSVPTPTLTGSCPLVSSASAAYLSAKPTAAAAVVPAGLATACLKSVPLDPENDVGLIDHLLPLVQLQSTLAYLKNPPEEYLEILSRNLQFQDPDADYNTVFSTVAGDVSIGDAFNRVLENMAIVNAKFDGIVNGELLHQVYELPQPPSTTTTTPTQSATATSTTSPAPEPTVPGYPYPVVKHFDDYVAGYFLNDTAYADTAVLVALSFESSAPGKNLTADFFEFRRVVSTFLDACREAGKTKLVIDLSGNGGGSVIEGFELYKQLFPSGEPWDGIRDFFGPNEFNGDEFTSLLRRNFSEPGGFGSSTAMTVVTGYGDVPARPEQPFAVEDIVVVTDGVCASTCTIFAGLLARQEGVRTIAMGGRPISSPMQAIGGVKGAEVLKFDDFIPWVVGLADQNDGLAPLGLPFPDTATPPILGSGGSFNWKNAYAGDDETSTPLQFVYEAANCKRFFTAENVFDVRTVWQDAADVAWGEGLCVFGSTTTDDGSIAADVLQYNADVRPAVVFPAVPGSPGTETTRYGSNCTSSSVHKKRSAGAVPKTFTAVETDIQPEWINLPSNRFGTS
ncbi:uncharacterized protein BCR38DRAFT_411935 [Pseudomassariella vexata]|uniref:Tail specific protease domain-containing protein n=1 Tax=Pseudomassariella vexata TaxID=1141098 RepID=A0A1Y2DNH1_9PEZI|nr:uncharacterized protein BCR38DRAFT_411935 [Pseudomassariella vexata]ORY60822.1 hypothetical protein BCR38DRAFT_411935 [Pseudomassariella vexata]